LFGIVWSSTAVNYYLDGVLVATNTTNVPQASMGFFSEACTYRNVYTGSPATKEARAYFRINTLQKTA
jgi:beta-glucanase (GH16 family)